MVKKRVHIFATGRVQGVYYRQQTLMQASELGVTGWVKNLMDGRVEAVFEGEAVDVDKLVAYCRKGPSFARVDHLQIDEEVYKDEFKTFRVTY